METTVAIVGAGQAGLAMSHCLTEISVDHVLLERNVPASSWRQERWDSLRLLTPNWMTRLPGFGYAGGDPEGFMTASDVAEYLEWYQISFDAPVVENTTVTRIKSGVRDRGFEIETSNGMWKARAVVVASGAASTPSIPTLSRSIHPWINQLAPIKYRNPRQLDEGAVLVVGASASGIQIADELARAAFDVAIAVGDHVRVPRRYRGMDIHWWMESLGLLDESIDQVEDQDRARELPSLQLVGSLDYRDLDINSIAALGVEILGRLVGVSDRTLMFSGGLANAVKSADLKLNRLLDTIDSYASATGLDPELPPLMRFPPTSISPPRTEVDISRFKTVIWATGYRPNYPWLDAGVLDSKGAIRHRGGVMSRPGMYVLGLPFLRRRNSSFIDGVGRDARDLTGHLSNYLDRVGTHS